MKISIGIKSFAIFWVIVFQSISMFGSNAFYITKDSPNMIDENFFKTGQPQGGDTIYIMADRTLGLHIYRLQGNSNNPIVISNKGGVVNINDANNWGAITFVDCQFIKITGTGSSANKYGFKLAAQTCGLAFAEYSTNCEAEFIEIDHTGFYGIVAKKNFDGNPPAPYPVFSNLNIHDTYIVNVTEGMYLGETKSPGMEFRHVRIYNNIIKNTGREGIQVANMVEDVEVYNNTIINSGLDQEQWQQNNFQIGDNTVGKYYNNVFIGAGGHGMAIFGAGNIEVSNNYFENNLGIYMDNRIFTSLNAPILIHENTFTQIVSTEIINNANELNPIRITNNTYDGTKPFLSANTLSQSNVFAANNINLSIPPITFQDSTNQVISNPDDYFTGTVPTVDNYNSWPVIDSIPKTFCFSGDTTYVQLHATVADNDILSFTADSLPSFASIVDSINGFSKLMITPQINDIGLHTFLVSASDNSHQIKVYTQVEINVALKTNHIPAIDSIAPMEVSMLQESTFTIHFSDKDADKINLKLEDAPEFVRAELVNDSTYTLFIKPKYVDQGIFLFQLAFTDGFCPEISYPVQLTVLPETPSPSTTIYRLNCGGPEIIAPNLNWESVYVGGSGKSYLTTTSHETGTWSYAGTNATTAPTLLFGNYSFVYPTEADLQWSFPVLNGKYEVHLFFREKQTEASTFDVLIENTAVLSNFSVFTENGENPIAKTFETTVKDLALTIDLRKITGNPKISGIEIIYLDKGNMPPQISPVPAISINESDSTIIPLIVTDELPLSSSLLSIWSNNKPDFITISKSTETNNFQMEINPDYESSGSYEDLKLYISDGEFTDSITFNMTVIDKTQPEYPTINIPEAIQINEGEVKTWEQFVSDPENDALSVSISEQNFASINNENGSWNLLLSPDYYSGGNYQLTIQATDSNGYKSEKTIEIVINEIIPQIILTPEMILDETPEGSINSPNLLVDEQNLTAINSGIPVSASWRPYYDTSGAPYFTTIDLGAIYDIEEIDFHDMNSTGEITFYSGTPENWELLYSDVTDRYNAWKTKSIQVTTRFLRLSISDVNGPNINEIVLWGTKNTTITEVFPQIILDDSMLIDEIIDGSINSPSLLVDEQNQTSLVSTHPSSQSWKPAYTNTEAPFSVIIDLGAYYDIEEIDFHDMNSSGTVIFSAENSGNWIELFTEVTNTYNRWKIKKIKSTSRFIRITIFNVLGANINEVVLWGRLNRSIDPDDYPIPDIIPVPEEPIIAAERIILNTSMITDEVENGSIDSPTLLVDEQDVSIENNLHPISKSWKPFYNSSNSPYSFYLDLGEEYQLSEICFHDMNSTAPIKISYGDTLNWIALGTENLDTYNSWKKKEISVKTRYLRFTVDSGIIAYFNELGLYGSKTQASPTLKNASVNPAKKENKVTLLESIKVFPTVFSNAINLSIINNDESDYQISLCNCLGQPIFKERIKFVDEMSKSYTDCVRRLIPGRYFLTIRNNKNGKMQSFQLIRSN